MTRPLYNETSLADALAFDWRGWHLSEKYDGVWRVNRFANCVVTGEAMRDGRFFAFDIPVAFGQDVRRLSWTEREQALTELFSQLNPKLNWHRCATGSGAEFIEAVLANGGEGIVAKPFDAKFGEDWFKVKRVQTFDVTVTAKLRGAIAIAYEGQDAGKCPLSGAKWNAAQIGDVIEIEAYRRNASGKFREPRFIRFREDKMIQPIQNTSGNSLSLTISL